MINSIILSTKNKFINGEVILPSSKSICNRLLIIQSICSDDFELLNLSDADDSQLLHNLLIEIHNSSNTNLTKLINTKNAGTVFRFLTAYLSICKGSFVLTGDNRMQHRPVHSLVNALIDLGADIEYVYTPGFPPLIIKDYKYKNNAITIDGSLSSQFTSAMLLIAPLLPGGIILQLEGSIASKPYIRMTLNLMEQFGVKYIWKDDTIIIKEQNYISKKDNYTIEGDWSASSYFYQIVAMADDASIFINDLNKDSLQGDKIVADVYKSFGVATAFEEKGIRLTKNSFKVDKFTFDFSNYPDLVPAVAVTSAALGIEAELTGLKNLKIKESDRLTTLVIELNKMGVETMVEDDDVLFIYKSKIKIIEPIETYNDHRIAMCFAPLALQQNDVMINNPEVVVKSFPDYFKELGTLCFEVQSI